MLDRVRDFVMRPQLSHRTRFAVIAVLSVLAVTLAGCSGEFNIRQTEPIRIQLDDTSSSHHVQVSSESKPQKWVVENTPHADAIAVNVTVTQVAQNTASVLVTIQDNDGATLATRQIQVGTDTTPSNTTNTTSPSTSSSAPASPQTIVQNIVVNVKGKDNVVVITEAQQGTADVNVAARDASAGDTTPTTAPTTAAPTTTYA